MNHDITHCSATDIRIEEDENGKSMVTGRLICDKRDTCHRYKAYLDLSNYNGMVSMTFPQDCIDNNYNLYWEDKENGQP